VRVKLANPAMLPRLMTYLAFDASVVVDQIADDEVELSFLGSLNADAQRMHTELRLRAWIAANPEAIAVLRE
jgi:hypothetical protein